MPEISIIMPAYGVERHIANAIESVLHQTFADWELIVVNDGSPDRSAEIAHSYAAKCDKIRVVDKPNGGLSDARNFGLQYANGKFIHFFDSDDFIDSDFYHTMISQASQADIVVAGYDVISEIGSSSTLTRRDLSPSIIGADKYGEQILQFACYAWNKIFRRDFLIENNLRYEVGLSRIEDVEFMSRAIDFRPRIKIATHAGYKYIQREELTLSKGFDENLIAINYRRIGLDLKMLKYFSKNPEFDEVQCRDYLSGMALISTINRLFDSASAGDPHIRNKYLHEMRCLIPQHLRTTRSGLRGLFDLLTISAMKYYLYPVISLLQNAR